MNYTESLIDRLQGVILTPKIQAQARLCILDYLGVTLAGARLSQEYTSRYIGLLSGNAGDATVLGSASKLPLLNAAFVNGMNAHVAELDDGHRRGMIHVGAPVLSALLPVAEVCDVPEELLLKSVCVGYEAAIRCACALQPSHKVRGYHTSGTCGTIGAAMAVATAFGQNREQMKTTLSAAAASASGLLELQEDGSEMKPYNIAQAAVGGIIAAMAGESGYVPPKDAVGGKRGFLHVLSDDWHPDALSDSDAKKYSLLSIYRKPYAACRHAHAPIEAALTIKQEHRISAEEIKSISVETYRLAISGHDHTVANTISEAKMSIPFSLAIALERGSVSVGDYREETLRDERIVSLSSRIVLQENSLLSSWVPEKRAAIVNITTKCGEEYSAEVDYPKGEPENPMSGKDLDSKFRDLAMYAGLRKDVADNVIRTVLSSRIDVKSIFGQIRR